jgi:hypothetical protein
MDKKRPPTPQEIDDGKARLLDRGGWEPVSQKIAHEVIPRIIREAHAYYDSIGIRPNNRPDVFGIGTFYLLLLTRINREPKHRGKEEYGACFMSYEAFAQAGLTEPRVRWMSEILEANGLIRTVTVRRANKTKKFYYPMLDINVVGDYVIDENGERIQPSNEVYLTESMRRKMRNKQE